MKASGEDVARSASGRAAIFSAHESLLDSLFFLVAMLGVLPSIATFVLTGTWQVSRTSSTFGDSSLLLHKRAAHASIMSCRVVFVSAVGRRFRLE